MHTCSLLAYFYFLNQERMSMTTILGPPGTPPRPPRDAPGPPGDPWGAPQTTKTVIARPIHSARSSQSLHPHPFVAMHLPNDSLALFHGVCIEKRNSSWSAAGPRRGRPKVSGGVDAHGRKESAHSAPGPGSPLYIVHYIYLYVYICGSSQIDLIVL